MGNENNIGGYVDRPIKLVFEFNTNSKYDFLPYDVKSVIIHNNTVIVNLNDGSKGVSKCSHKDEFDTYTGFTIAYYKAKNSKSFKLKEVLDNCLQSANEKGYDKAILKNY